MALPSFESAKPVESHGKGLELPSHVYGDLWGPQTPQKQQPAEVAQNAPAAAAALKQAGVEVPSWLPDATTEQLSQIISDAAKNGTQIKFTTPGESAAAGTMPDYRIDENGKLIATGKQHNPGDPITIQVESKQGEAQAKQYSQQLQKMAIQEQINYVRINYPNDKSRLAALQNDLSKVSQAPSEPTWQIPQTAQPQTDQQPITAGDAPGVGDPPGTGYDGGASPGGGRNGGGFTGDGGQGVADAGPPAGGGGRWQDQVGQPPARGYTPGEFNPDDANTMEPVDKRNVPTPVAGDMKMHFDGNTPPSGITPQQIEEFLAGYHSPVANQTDPKTGQLVSQCMYDICMQHHIDPAAMLGFFLQESTCGTARNHLALDNKSIGNVRGTSYEGMSGHGYRAFSTWANGVNDWCNLIDKYRDNHGLEYLSQVIHRYAPASDGNNEGHYVSLVKGTVQKFANMNAGQDGPKTA
jgi:hypothetical protein